MHTRIIVALAALAAGPVAAQEGRPDPSLPQGKAAPFEYRSAFEAYRPFGEEKPTPWRDANETVKSQDGGHASHGAKPPADAKPSAKPSAPSGGHGSHK